MAALLDPRSPRYWETFTVAHGPLKGCTLERCAASVLGILQLYRIAFNDCYYWVKPFERRAVRRFFAEPKWEQALRAALDSRRYHQKQAC